MLHCGFIEGRAAYIPSSNGYYKLDPCIVESIDVEAVHFCHGRGLIVNNTQMIQDRTITLRVHKMEEIDDPFNHIPEVLLSNFSNLDLLKELEKRTK